MSFIPPELPPEVWGKIIDDTDLVKNFKGFACREQRDTCRSNANDGHVSQLYHHFSCEEDPLKTIHIRTCAKEMIV
jgi:hypothetical protein